ncbi:positive regulation of cell-substrate adhesion [Balamuthia mandrillaris]
MRTADVKGSARRLLLVLFLAVLPGLVMLVVQARPNHHEQQQAEAAGVDPQAAAATHHWRHHQLQRNKPLTTRDFSDRCRDRPCAPHADCVPALAGFECRCRAGFHGDGHQRCYDIDECVLLQQDPKEEEEEHGGEEKKAEERKKAARSEGGELWLQPCDRNAECRNLLGSYECLCKEGFEGDGFTCTYGQAGRFSPILREEERDEGGAKAGDERGRGGEHKAVLAEEEEAELIFLELRGGDVIYLNQLEAMSYIDPGFVVKSRKRSTQKRTGGTEGEAEETNLREANVFYEIPAGMNAGIMGTYILEYRAIEPNALSSSSSSRTISTVVAQKNRTVIVTDIDECALGRHACSENADCENMPGHYHCSCRGGFSGDGFKCVDVDECKEGIHSCHSFASCTNLKGGFSCSCLEGYEGNGFVCRDVNECERNLHDCHEHAICHNLEGSYSCTCKEDYEGNGFFCKPQNSCEMETHDCHERATCVKDSSLPEGYRCECAQGFQGDGRWCEDVNECRIGAFTCPPHSHCSNTIGSYKCLCDEGFEEADDYYSCIDIDECARETDSCSPLANCTNTEGGYLCQCKEGYVGDGRDCYPMPQPPAILLRGRNPVAIRQCESYVEEGFTLNENKMMPSSSSSSSGYFSSSMMDDKLHVSVSIPPSLMADRVMETGLFQIKYTVINPKRSLDLSSLAAPSSSNDALQRSDEEQQQWQTVSTVIRNVTVLPINPCDLPEGHPCRHKCHPFARCVYVNDDRADATTRRSVGESYRCECMEGFDMVVDEETGETVCKDNIPPVIELVNGEVVVMRACRVCQWFDPGEDYDEWKHGGFHAYDPLPDGRAIDLTHKVMITNRTTAPNEWMIFYSVKDSAGNEAEMAVRVVRKEVEDLLVRIENMEEFLRNKFAEFEPSYQQLDSILWYFWLILKTMVLGFLGLLLFYLIPRAINLLKIKFAYGSEKPPFQNFADGYDLFYALTRPWWSPVERSRQIQIEYQRRYYDK